jgi:hypothetical protein
MTEAMSLSPAGAQDAAPERWGRLDGDKVPGLSSGSAGSLVSGLVMAAAVNQVFHRSVHPAVQNTGDPGVVSTGLQQIGSRQASL